VVDRETAHLTKALTRAVTHDNAAALYGLS
jgi:hypothetical protein